MRKLFCKYHTGYCGEDGCELVEFPEDMTTDQIDEEVYWAAVEHASQYGHEMCSEDCDDEECEMEHPGNSNIEGSWEDYNAEKHDMYLT